MELPRSFPSPSPKNPEKSTPNKIPYISENGLSSSNIKKILIFSQKKAFLIFSEMEPCTFQSKLEK